MTREDWIDSFVTYVIKQMPQAPKAYVSVKADELYARLGSEYDPVAIAEAEWEALRTPGWRPSM